MRILLTWIASFFLLIGAVGAKEAEKTFKREQLQQLLAPIALYPDALLAQVLMASTYPLQVAQAARWQVDNSKLSGPNLEKALAVKDWDPSVKSLVTVPSVLKMMNDRLEWTQQLGDAFLVQQSDVMNEVQYLRFKAQEAGNLKSNKQQTVTKKDSVIIIEPASTQVVYVPVYNSTIIYGTWWYPAYPPYYYPPPAGSAFVAGVFWGTAIAVSANYWGWGHCDWHRTNIDIDVNRFNQININKTQISSGSWRHDPANRGPVPYRDARTREQFGSKTKSSPPSREARGFGEGLQNPKGDKPSLSNRPSTQPVRQGGSDFKGTVSRPTAFDGADAQTLRASSERGHKSRAAMGESRGASRGDFGGGNRQVGGRRR